MKKNDGVMSSVSIDVASLVNECSRQRQLYAFKDPRAAGTVVEISDGHVESSLPLRVLLSFSTCMLLRRCTVQCTHSTQSIFQLQSSHDADAPNKQLHLFLFRFLFTVIALALSDSNDT